jgi:hypothetical protein
MIQRWRVGRECGRHALSARTRALHRHEKKEFIMRQQFMFITTLILAAATASAGVVEYENEQRPDFFAAIGGEANASVVDFAGYPDSTPISDQWSHLGVHFSSSGSIVTRGFDDFLFPNNGWGARGEPEIILDFDEPMQWIAADFPGTLAIELYSEDQLFYTSSTLATGGVGNFGGLISDMPFDSARIFDPLDNILFMDDLHFGPVIAVPTPGVLAVLALLLLPFRRRTDLKTEFPHQRHHRSHR